MEQRSCWLLAVALAGYLAMMAESCPMASSVSPASGSADPSFVYNISGAGLMNVNVTSTAGTLNYTAVSDSMARFSFQTGSSAMGRVVVRLTAPFCSAVVLTVLVTIPFAPILEGDNEGVVQFLLNSTNSSIACDILGSTRAPAWYYNNVPLVTGDGRTLQNDSIQFDRVLSQHSGWYTCVASNKYGRTERDYLLIVVAAPAFLVPPLPPSGRSFYEVQSGSTVILPCTGYSVPPPNVRWFLEGNHLDTGNGYEIEPTTSSLIISNFTKRASTNFSCSLQNVEGTIKSEDVILRRLSIPSGDFSPSTLNSTYTISSNEDITLNCYTNSSQPNRLFQWYKNSNTIEGATNATFTLTGSSTGEAWGHYCCRITNLLALSSLDIRCTVVIVNLESQLDVSPPTTVSLPTGRSISLLCGGTTMNRINLPQFTWTRNSTTIPTGLSRISVQQSRYAITSLLVKDTQIGDSGTYRCNGVNPANNISASTRVIIADVCNGTSNLLAGPEETGLSEDFVVDINGEICFEINDSETALEYDMNELNISETQQIHFSGKMRAVSSSSLQPLIILTIADMQPIDITLPFPTSTAWQWVWHKVELNITTSSALRLKLQMTTTGSSDNMSPVYFDDVCLTFSGITQPPSTLVAPSAIVRPSPTSSSTTIPPVDTAVWTNVIIAVSISGGSALLIIVIISIVLFICGCVYRSKSKGRKEQLADRYSARFEKDSEKVAVTAFNPYSSATPVQSVPASPTMSPPGPVTKKPSLSSLLPGTPVKGPATPTTPQPRPSIASQTSVSSHPFSTRPAPSPPVSPTLPVGEGGYEAISPTSNETNRITSVTEDAYEAICPSNEGSVATTPTTPRQLRAVLKHSASKSSISSLPSRPVTPAVTIPTTKEGNYLEILPSSSTNSLAGTAPVAARTTRSPTTVSAAMPIRTSIDDNYEAITPSSSTSHLPVAVTASNPFATRPAPTPPSSPSNETTPMSIPSTTESDYMAISPPNSTTSQLRRAMTPSSLPIPSAKEEGYMAINPSNRESANIYALPTEDEYSYVSTSAVISGSELEKKISKQQLLTAADEDHIYY